jgi:hypothetical protein
MPGATVRKKTKTTAVSEPNGGAIDPGRLYTFTELGRLSGLTARKIRREVEEGRMDYLQTSPERGRHIQGQQYLDWVESCRKTQRVGA